MANYIPFPMTEEDRPKEKGWYVVVNQQIGKLYTLEYWDEHRYHPGLISCVARLYFQAWAFGGCSANALWGFYHIQNEAYYTEEFVYGFMKTLTDLWNKSGYDSHRVFIQAPFGKEGIFKYICELVGHEDLRPAYKFENKSHASSEQRLYDVPADDWWAWMKEYEQLLTEREKGLSQKAALRAAQEKAIDTIIKEKQNEKAYINSAVKLGNGGQRPFAPGEFRPAAEYPAARAWANLDF